MKQIQDVAQEHTFRLHKTEIEIRNLHELADALEIMSDESYSHHVSAERNDFANWVNVALKDVEMGNKLAVSKSRKQSLAIVQNHIKRAQGKTVQPSLMQQTHFKILEFAVGILFGILIGIFLAQRLF